MTPCIISGYAKNSFGYGLVPVNKGKNHVRHHRLAYCKANNLQLHEIESFVVRHKCDNPGCINPEHLELGTQADNAKDTATRKRGSVGTKNKHAKLTEALVLEIRSATGTQASVAKRFDITQSTVSSIQSRTTWSHI
jgi:hypothetical protein